MTTAPAFRFDVEGHTYTLGGRRLPSATELIERGGLLGEGQRFYTEASRDRGTEVHRLCAEWDLGSLDPLKCDSPQRGFLYAYMAAGAVLKWKWDAIEEAECDPAGRFAQRIDRVGIVFDLPTVLEIKSGGKHPERPIVYVDEESGKKIVLPQYSSRPHAVQCALGAMLWAPKYHIKAEDMQRLIVYPKATGKFSVETCNDPRDYDTARQLLARFCQ